MFSGPMDFAEDVMFLCAKHLLVITGTLWIHDGALRKLRVQQLVEVEAKAVSFILDGQQSKHSALIAMIADEDAVVGFLMAGVGNVDLRRKTNYLMVDSKSMLFTSSFAHMEKYLFSAESVASGRR